MRFVRYSLLVALSMGHAKPWEVDDLFQVLPFMFKEATQGDKALRDLSNLSQLLPSLLNPNPKKYFEVLTQRDKIIAQMDEALESWDVWLCPVATCTAFTHQAKGAAIDVDGRKIPYLLASGAYTMPFAFTGHPVVVIPIGQDERGLPVGVQVVGKRWKEMELLNIVRQLAGCTQGFQVPPGY
jgi:amidase